MKVSVAADERSGVADAVVRELERRGHEPVVHGALSDAERDDWAWASEAAARDVAGGAAEQGIVCCWTGTGASIAANKVDVLVTEDRAPELHALLVAVGVAHASRCSRTAASNASGCATFAMCAAPSIST